MTVQKMLPAAALLCAIAMPAAVPAPALAADEARCLSLWKSVDVDANGALEVGEDGAGYFAAVEESGAQPLKPGSLSRSEFVDYCKKGVIAAADMREQPNSSATTQGPAAGRDMGKGDLTPGMNPLSQADAEKKLTASGFKELEGLALDGQGVWRGTATANGKRVKVAIDPQGDIVAR